MYKRVRRKQKCARACQNMRTQIYALCAHICTQNFPKIVLIVYFFVMALVLKFYKDPSCKITLNTHAKVINACSMFWYTCVHVFALFALTCLQIFTKFFLVVHYSVMSLSFKFHKDMIFRWGDICKIERCVFFLPLRYILRLTEKTLLRLPHLLLHWELRPFPLAKLSY